MIKNERNQINVNNKKDILDIIKDLSNNYSSYNNIYLKNLTNFISFNENIALIYESLSSKIIFPKIENKTLFNFIPSTNIINDYYNFHRNFLNKLIRISNNIKNNMIPKLENYKKRIENENTNLSLYIEKLINKIIMHQQKILEANKNYTSEYEKFKQLELDSIKKLNNTSMYEFIHKSLDDQRKKMTNYSVIQQQETQVLNKVYNEEQEEMIKKLFNMKENYYNDNDKIFESVKNYLSLWKNNIINYSEKESKQLMDNIEVFKEKQNSDNFIDIILINESNKLILYNKWKFNLNNNNNNNNRINRNNNLEEVAINFFKTPKLPYTDIKYDPENMLIIKDLNLDNNKNELSKNFTLNTQMLKEKDSLNYFFLSLRKNKDILNNQLSEVVNLLENKTGKIKFYHDFCDIYLFSNNEEVNSLFEFTNFTNMAHLKTFLNNILENISSQLTNNNADLFNLLDKIIIIGEKTLFDNVYLCSLLNKNKIFNNKDIWENCIKFKIIDILNEICYQSTSNISLNENINKLYNTGSKFLGGFLGFESKKQSKKDNLVEFLGLTNHLPKYYKLTDEKKIIFNKNQAPIIIHEVFKAYIRHMSNYGYSLENSINVIYDIYSYYQMSDNDIINYFLNFNKICDYSCKNKTQKISLIHKKEKTKEKIKEIKTKRINYLKYPTRIRNAKSIIIILKKIFIFLEDKEKIQLILLSTKIKKELSKKIYKYILKQKSTPVSTHIHIWKIFLYSNELKLEKNDIYNNLKKEIEKPETKQKYQKIFKIIDSDISRTEFIHNKVKGQNASKNILKCLQLYNFENNYCQGMNYIAAFLYENTLSEEESYYILLSLFMNKKYTSVFKNEMVQLKNYFLIMDKLIYLFLPKIYYHFKKNQIIPDFFLSPYFITLFTHIYSKITEKNNIFILRIWDGFIINGWKSLFEVILTLLKIKEKNILNFQGDELVDFLVNKINVDDVFLNKNYEYFEEMKDNFIITEELMTNLEEDIILENKLKK